MTAGMPRREFAVLFAVLLLVAAGNTAMQTLLPGIARSVGMPDMMVAFIFSVSALLWTFSAPYWARQSDKHGRRRLIGLGVIGFGASMLGCAVVVYAGLHGLMGAVATFLVFAMMRMLFGVFGSASNPASQAYVASRTSEAARTSALAILASAFGLGTIIGPAVAPLFVLEPLGLSGPMFMFAALAIFVLMAVRRILPDDDPQAPAQSFRADSFGAAASEPLVSGTSSGASLRAATAPRSNRLSVRDPRVWPFLAFGFASGSVQAATGQAMGFLIIDRMGGDALAGSQNIAIAFMAGAGATLLAQWGIIPNMKLTPPPLIRWGTAIAALGTLGIAFADSFHALVLAFAVSSLGYGLARPGFTAGASLAVARHEQGGVAGAITAMNGACYIAAPAVGIGLYSLKPELPYWLGAAALAGLLAYAFAVPALGLEPLRDD